MLVNGTVNEEFHNYIPHDGDVIEIQFNRRSWHNAVEPTDVDGRNGTTVNDAQLVIEELTSRRFSDGHSGAVSAVPKKFLDVDNNSIISPLDALLIINDVHSRSVFAPLSASVVVSVNNAMGQSNNVYDSLRDFDAAEFVDQALIQDYVRHDVS